MSRVPELTRVDRAERHRRMVAAYVAGASTYDLADRFGMNRSHVSAVMRLYGVVRRPGRPRDTERAA